MLKVSDAVRQLVEHNTFLQTGLFHGLLNLSQTARHLLPQVESRTRKSVQASAIVMNLSRLAEDYRKNKGDSATEIEIENMIVHTDLAISTYLKGPEVHKAINKVYNRIQKAQSYITITEGIKEITLIYSRKHVSLVDEMLSANPVYRHTDVAALGITFPPHYISVPGLFYYFYQQAYFQNINVLEQASTATELILYMNQEDVQLAFQTFYNRFIRNP